MATDSPAASAANAPAPSPAVGGVATANGSTDKHEVEVHSADGGQQVWHAQLPPELASEKSLHTFKDVPALAKSYVEATKKMGSAVWLPSDKDKPEDRAAKINDIHSKLGRPASPDEYKVLIPDMRDGVWGQEHHTTFLKAAHEAGLNPAQVEKVYGAIASNMNAILPDANAARAKVETQFKEEWGANYDQYMSYAVRGAEYVGGNELMAALDETGAGNHPVVIRVLARLGKSLAEDNLLPGDSSYASSQQDIQAKIDKIMGDPKHPYYQKEHPDHKRAVQELSGFYQQLYGATI